MATVNTIAASIAMDLDGLVGAGIEVPGSDSPLLLYSESNFSKGSIER